MKKTTERIRKFVLVIVTGFLVSSVFFASCSSKTEANEQNRNEDKISIVTSFYVMYDFASKIGGDRVLVSNLLPPGSDPHGWEPSPKDIIKIENSDIFIFNGANMEGWVHKVLDSIENKELIVLETSKGVNLLKGGHHHEHENDEVRVHEEDELFDPHVWLDPKIAKLQMRAIAEALSGFDPENSEYYWSSFEKYSRELDKLDKEYKEAVSDFVKKDVVVSHEAFGYLCSAYGLNQIGISGLDAEAEPTASRMVEVANFVKDNDVSVIFFDNMVSPKVANTIAEATGAGVDILNPIATLSKKEIEEGKDYFSIMRENLKALKRALADGGNE